MGKGRAGPAGRTRRPGRGQAEQHGGGQAGLVVDKQARRARAGGDVEAMLPMGTAGRPTFSAAGRLFAAGGDVEAGLAGHGEVLLLGEGSASVRGGREGQSLPRLHAA